MGAICGKSSAPPMTAPAASEAPKKPSPSPSISDPTTPVEKGVAIVRHGEGRQDEGGKPPKATAAVAAPSDKFDKAKPEPASNQQTSFDTAHPPLQHHPNGNPGAPTPPLAGGKASVDDDERRPALVPKKSENLLSFFKKDAPPPNHAPPSPMKKQGTSFRFASSLFSKKGGVGRADDVASHRDPQGYSKLCDIVKKLREGVKMYDDPDFRPDEASIRRHPGSSRGFFAHKIKEVNWLRPIDMRRAGFPAKVFRDGASPEDVKQGAVGDCYLLAALANSATEPEIIENLIIEDFEDVGVYGVQFFRAGQWQTVIVDSWFPCLSDALPVFARWIGDDKETWAMVVEKAWAKLNGSYEAINSGSVADTLCAITGGIPARFAWKLTDATDEALMASTWAALHALINAPREEGINFLSASTFADVEADEGGGVPGGAEMSLSQTGLVGNHAYSILALREVTPSNDTSKTHRLVNVRNPWGQFEWTGDWGDASPLWTDEIKATVNFVAADDGAFWMAWGDFVTRFCHVGVCRILPLPHRADVAGEWVGGVNAGGPTRRGIAANPTWLVTTNAAKLTLVLEVPDPRREGLDTTESCLFVFARPKTSAEPFVASLRHQIAAIWNSERINTLEVALPTPPSDFEIYITAAPWHGGVESKFWLSARSTETVALTPHASGGESVDPAVLKAPPFSLKCVTCGLSLADESSKATRGARRVRCHASGDCFKCSKCGGGFDDERPLFKVDVIAGEGVWSMFCRDCWMDVFPPKCLHCGKPVEKHDGFSGGSYDVAGGGVVHSECYEAYSIANAARCAECNCAVWKTAEFSGAFRRIAGGGVVHEECWGVYRLKVAAPCGHCGEPIAEIAGRFSGMKYSLEGGGVEVHEECYDAYRAQRAEKCAKCGEAILKKEGRFSGTFFEVGGGGKVHEECFETSCAHCGEVIAAVEGRFSGAFFAVEGGGDVHEECVDAYTNAAAPKCAFCNDAIAAVEGKWGGGYFETARGNVHAECFPKVTDTWLNAA